VPSRIARFWVRGFVREIIDSRTTGMAAEMAFWLFLALIPLAAVAGLVAAKVAVSSADVAALLNTLPPETRHMVSRQLNHVAAWRGGAVGAPAAVVFVWLASGGIHSVFELLEVKAGLSRPWWKRRLIALGSCLGLSIGTAVIAVLAGGLRRVLAFLHGAVSQAGLSREAGFVDSALRSSLGMLTAVGLVAGLYYIGIPRRARSRLPVLPGALLAVGLQVMLGYGYVFYLSKVGVQSAYQAGLSIIGVTMIALYLSSFALLVGASLNAMLAKTR
jgi:membrane protein